METKKRTVDAVHDDYLLEMLESLGLKNKFLNGKLNCAFCSDTISWENLHSIFPDSGAVKLCCMKPECINMLIARLQNRS